MKQGSILCAMTCILRCMIFGKPAVDALECLPSVVIVRVNNTERFIDHIPAGQDRLSRAPGFLPVCRKDESVRKVILFLEYVGNLCVRSDPVSDHFPEVLLQVFADHEHDPVKSRLQRIIDGIIHNDLA